MMADFSTLKRPVGLVRTGVKSYPLGVVLP